MAMQVKIDHINVYHKGPIQATYHEYTYKALYKLCNNYDMNMNENSFSLMLKYAMNIPFRYMKMNENHLKQ